MLSVEGYIALPSGSVGGMSRSFPDTEKKEVCIYIYIYIYVSGTDWYCPALPRSLKLPAFCCWASSAARRAVYPERIRAGLFGCLGLWRGVVVDRLEGLGRCWVGGIATHVWRWIGQLCVCVYGSCLL
jgi:hypothetical protein